MRASRSWLRGIAVVDFNVDVGCVVEAAHPADLLGEEEGKLLCHCAFPDSNSDLLGDTLFAFRLPLGKYLDAGGAAAAAGQDEAGEDGEGRGVERARVSSSASPSSFALPPTDGFQYGVSFFRQTRDASRDRGFFQKALVVLSLHPIVDAMADLVRVVTPIFFDFGPGVLEAAFHNVAAWPEMLPGRHYEAPVMGSVLAVETPVPYAMNRVSNYIVHAHRREPRTNDIDNCLRYERHLHMLTVRPETDVDARTPWHLLSTKPGKRVASRHRKASRSPSPAPGATREPDVRPRTAASIPVSLLPVARPPFYTVNLFVALGRMQFLKHMWTYWEAALTGRPILVKSPQPHMCSNAVLGLVSLIAPLPYAGDFRPYFTINDPAFNLYSKARGIPLILGVTNPIFLKLMDQWPVHLHIGSPLPPGMELSKQRKATLLSLNKEESVVSFKPVVRANKKLIKSVKARLAKAAAPAGRAATGLVRGGEQAGDDEIGELLREHFFTLNLRVLEPFRLYFLWQTMPTKRDAWRLPSTVSLTPFDQPTFLKTVTFLGDKDPLRAVVSDRSHLVEFYRRVTTSRNFQAWFALERQRSADAYALLLRKFRYEATMAGTVETLSEVERVDLLLRIQEELGEEQARLETLRAAMRAADDVTDDQETQLVDGEAVVRRLRRHLARLRAYLPDHITAAFVDADAAAGSVDDDEDEEDDEEDAARDGQDGDAADGEAAQVFPPTLA